MLAYINKLIDKNKGSISISSFMHEALYNEKYGYYMQNNNLLNDFITAPEISQLFGEMMAVCIIHMYKNLGNPKKFSLVEFGPGKGTLMQDIIRVIRNYDDVFCAITIHFIEVSPILRNIQKQALTGINIEWHESIDNLPEHPTLFLANEFFDALPINQFIYYNKQWYENRIARCSGDGLQIIQNTLKDENIRLSLNGIAEFNGSIVEICAPAIEILNKIEKKMHKHGGFALIIDYGYIHSSYKSTLQAVKQHNYIDLFENIGGSDITAHVNFQALKDSLKYTKCDLLTQREFLYLFGIKERVNILIKNKEHEETILREFFRLTESMGTLFKVMMISK